MKMFWIAGAVLLAVVLTQKANNILAQLQIGVGLPMPDAFNLRLNLPINVFSPLPAAITLDSVSGSVFAAGNKIADFMQTTPVPINPGQNSFSVNAYLLPGAIISNLSNLLRDIRVDYRLTSGPLNYSGAYQVI